MKISLFLLAAAFSAMSASAFAQDIGTVSDTCRDVAQARAQVMVVFIDAFAERIRQENEKLEAQGAPACPGSLLMTDSENKYEPPKGTVDVTVSSPSSSSFGSFGFPGGTSLGQPSSGGGTSGSLVFSVKTSVTFTFANPQSYKCVSIYSHPFYTGEAAKLVNQPAFNDQLAAACKPNIGQ